LHVELAPLQLSLHSLPKQPKLAQLPSAHGTQLGNIGTTQSELLTHFAELQSGGPAWQRPSPLQNEV